MNLRWRRWQWQWWWQWCWSGHGQWCVKSGMWIFFRPTKIWATLVGAILLFIVVLLSDTTFIFHIKGRLMSSIPTDFNSRYLWVEATMEICVLIDCLHPCLHPGCTVMSRDNMHPWYAPLICTPGKDGLQKIQDHKEEGQRKCAQECIVVWGCTWVTLVSFVHYLRCNACEIGS